MFWQVTIIKYNYINKRVTVVLKNKNKKLAYETIIWRVSTKKFRTCFVENDMSSDICSNYSHNFVTNF